LVQSSSAQQSTSFYRECESSAISPFTFSTIQPPRISWVLPLTVSSIIFIAPDLSRFAPRTVYRTFIPLDFTSLILQAVGGAISSSTDKDSSIGVNIALAGLGLQVATLVALIVLVVDYLVRSKVVWSKINFTTRFRVFALALATATILILVRCCYRVYELNQGYQRTSSALRDQGLFIGLESVYVVDVRYD
jgi:hypothetical protein